MIFEVVLGLLGLKNPTINMKKKCSSYEKITMLTKLVIFTRRIIIQNCW